MFLLKFTTINQRSYLGVHLNECISHASGNWNSRFFSVGSAGLYLTLSYMCKKSREQFPTGFVAGQDFPVGVR